MDLENKTIKELEAIYQEAAEKERIAAITNRVIKAFFEVIVEEYEKKYSPRIKKRN